MPDFHQNQATYFDVANSLGDRLESFLFLPPAKVECSDKWLLSSAVQKLIRRGHEEAAFAVACRLYQLDPAYLYRRLPVIAFEEVGIADLSLCVDVMLLCSARRWWKDDAMQTIAYITQSLARAIKCRALCDLLCWGQILARAQPELIGRESRALLLEAVDPGLMLSGCAARLALVAERAIGGREDELSKPIRSLASLAGPTALETLLAPMCRRTAGMSIMLLASRRLAGPCHVEQLPLTPVQLIAGVPDCAVDQYTRIGRAVIAQFVAKNERVKRLVNDLPRGVDAVKLVSMGVFHVDGSLLDRRLASDALDDLRDEVAQAELEALGLPSKSGLRQSLYGHLEAEMKSLTALRVGALRRAFEMDPPQEGAV